MTTNKSLGKVVVKNLYRQGKSQKWLANEIGVSSSAVSAIITGRANPSQKTLKNMSDVLSINIDELNACLHI